MRYCFDLADNMSGARRLGAEASGYGTELPIPNARASAAIGGKADPDQTTLDKLDL
jgi:hypothetical protein